MPDPLRPVAVAPELRDAIDDPPTPGAHVIALGLGGCLAQAVWTSESDRFFVAWMPYPKVSPALRARLATMQLRRQRITTSHNQAQPTTTSHNKVQQ